MGDNAVYERRKVEVQADLAVFHNGALWPAKFEDGVYVRDGIDATNRIEDIKDCGFYIVPIDPVLMQLQRLDGWKDSMVAGGEAAAGHVAVRYLKSLVQGPVEMLKSTGGLEAPNKKLVIGQIDGGAVADGIILVVSKKTRLLPGNAAALAGTISAIEQYKKRPWDVLSEFRGRKIYGALMAEMLPGDEDDRELVLSDVKDFGFALFLRNGAEYDCQVSHPAPLLPQPQ